MSAGSVYLAFPLIVGIAAGCLTACPARPAASTSALAWVVAWLALTGRVPRLFVASAALCAGAAGATLGSLAIQRAHAAPIRRIGIVDPGGQRTSVRVEGILRHDASPTDSGAQLLIDVERVWKDGRWEPSGGGLRASVGGNQVPAAIDRWTRGRRVVVGASLGRPQRYRNPGVPDQERALLRRGIAVIGSVKSAALVQVLEKGSWFDELAAAVRAWVRRQVRATVEPLSPTSAGVVTAVLIGDRTGLDPEVERRLQDAGTFHVVAISGGNIAILAVLVVAVLRLTGTPWRARAVVAASLLGVYGLVVGTGASVARATVVAIACFAGRALDLRARPLHTAATAGAGLLVFDPLWVFDVGTWLTFGATAGILLGGVGSRTPWPVPVTSLWRATWCAEMAVLPVGAFAFSRVTLAGLVLNFAAIPLMGVVQSAGLLTIALHQFLPTLARGAARVTHLASVGLLESARGIEVAPWASWRVPPPSPVVVAAYYVALSTWWLGPASRLMRGIALVGLAVTSGLVLTGPAQPRWLTWQWGSCRPVPGELAVTFLDVGQGDAALVRLPDGRAIAIDAGGLPGSRTFDIGERVVVPALWAHGVRSLSLLVLTHGHPDHIGGAATLIDEFRPNLVWEGVPVVGHLPTDLVRHRASQLDVRWRRVEAGLETSLGRVRLRVVSPPAPDWERREVRNDDSVVFDLRYGDVSVLFTGDAGATVESRVAGIFEAAAVRVLKVPHHGSRFASSSAFLEAVRPSVAVVSAGAGNAFGHPVEATLARYRKLGIPVYRTDESGAITVVSDGRAIRVATCAGASTLP